MRGFDAPGAENVKYGIAYRQQIVGDNPSMASPPYCFCAHDGAALHSTERAQPNKAGTKIFAHGVIGVVMETLVLPERIDIR